MHLVGDLVWTVFNGSRCTAFQSLRLLSRLLAVGCVKLMTSCRVWHLAESMSWCIAGGADRHR